MSLLFCCKVLFYCKVHPLQKKLTIFKTTGTSRQKATKIFNSLKTILCKKTNHKAESLNTVKVKHILEEQIVLFIASAKIPERGGSILPFSFYGQLPDYQSYVFSLIYSVGEFSFKGVKTWAQSKVFILLFCVWCVSRELGSRGSSRFSCVTPVVEAFSERVVFRIPSNISDGAPQQKQPTALTLINCCQAFSQSNWHLSSFPSVPSFAFFSVNESFQYFCLSDIL